jgi:hypothetical protein
VEKIRVNGRKERKRGKISFSKKKVRGTKWGNRTEGREMGGKMKEVKRDLK